MRQQKTNKRRYQKTTSQQRRQAAAMLSEGVPQREIARQLGVSSSTLCRWHKNWISNDRLKVGPPRWGRSCRLNHEQLEKLRTALLEGPSAHGYSSQFWTLARIACLIEKLFGVKYNPCSVWYVMRYIGFSCQKPIVRGKERDDKAVETWTNQRWPEIQKRGENLML